MNFILTLTVEVHIHADINTKHGLNEICNSYNLVRAYVLLQKSLQHQHSSTIHTYIGTNIEMLLQFPLVYSIIRLKM